MYGIYSAQILGAILKGDFHQIFDLAKWFAFVAIFLMFIVVSIVIDHHWKHYGVRKRQIRIFRILYYGVGGVLLCIMTGSFFILVF